MSRKTKYKKYDAVVRAAISVTGRPDLFPNLKIPRMTAQYWIRQGFEINDPIIGQLALAINEAKYESDDLRKQLQEKEAVINLLHYVFKVLGFRLQWKQVAAEETRSKILDAIALAMGAANRDNCLAEIGLSLSRYKRWRRERRICGFTGKKACPRGNTNQLTFAEVETMKRLVTSKEFAHFPIRSLHYYAKREGLLFCSYTTWRKYVDRYQWKRLRKVFRERKARIGIRAEHPNEIWHLDVSVFVLPNKTKCFIQPIIDNYSRYVLAWQVMESYDGARTGTLLGRALIEAAVTKQAEKQLQLIVDGGGENRSQEVENLEGLGHFRKQIARFEISSSNSIVEVLFRSLKNNYLYHQDIKTFASLKGHVDFWFNEHNKNIPHSSFDGETPFERFQQTWNESNITRILVSHEEAVRLRIKENQKIFCKECESTENL